MVEPTIIRTTPRNLSKSGLGSPLDDGSLSEIDACSPIMRRRLSELACERKDKVGWVLNQPLKVYTIFTSSGSGYLNRPKCKEKLCMAICKSMHGGFGF